MEVCFSNNVPSRTSPDSTSSRATHQGPSFLFFERREKKALQNKWKAWQGERVFWFFKELRRSCFKRWNATVVRQDAPNTLAFGRSVSTVDSRTRRCFQSTLHRGIHFESPPRSILFNFNLGKFVRFPYRRFQIPQTLNEEKNPFSFKRGWTKWIQEVGENGKANGDGWNVLVATRNAKTDPHSVFQWFARPSKNLQIRIHRDFHFKIRRH